MSEIYDPISGLTKDTEAANEIVVKPEPKEEPKLPSDLSLDALPQDERTKILEYVNKINVKDTAFVLSFGSGAQEQMTKFADTALENVRNKEMGAMGSSLTELVTQLEGFGADSQPGKGILGFLKRGANQIASLKTRYEKVSVSVDKIADTLEDHRVQLLRDIVTLDRLYEENLAYYRQLCLYIMAGREKMKKLNEVDLPEKRNKAIATGDAADAQAANDLANAIDRFEKKVYDLELTRQISIQTAPQIRLIQNNDTLMAEKIHSAIVNTLPLWKNQMVLALGIENSRQALAAQRHVTDATNRMLRQNAEILKTSTIDTARESERAIVDIETLVVTNQALIDTLTEVASIQKEGRMQRNQAEAQLQTIENQLKQKLLEMQQEKR